MDQTFSEQGLEYEPPTLVFFTGSVNSGCGNATAQTGPFYCSADQSLYIDLSFFSEMRSTLGADGDFAYAYVIAHEVGHHVQYLLGTLTDAHQRMSRLSEAEANKISVALELQADYYAGVWAHHDNKMFGSLEDGDIEEALDAAQKIGDDYLQKRAQGYAVPDSFTHGHRLPSSRASARGSFLLLYRLQEIRYQKFDFDDAELVFLGRLGVHFVGRAAAELFEGKGVLLGHGSDLADGYLVGLDYPGGPDVDIAQPFGGVAFPYELFARINLYRIGAFAPSRQFHHYVVDRSFMLQTECYP